MSETPSENTNLLLELCRGVAAGRAPASDLDEALHRCDQELADARDAFVQQVQEEPGLLEALTEPITAVIDGFEAYGRALDRVAEYFEKGDTAHLDEAPAAMAAAYNQLFEALMAYEWAYLGHGEEPHPALNLVQKAMAALRAGQMPDERFDELLDRLWQHFTEGIEVFEKDPDPQRAHRGANACRTAMAGIQDMDAWFEDRRDEVLERGYGRMRQGCLLLIEQVQESVGEALVESPTGSPQVNWVLQAGRAVLDRVSPPDLLERAVEWFEPQLAESYFQFEQCATAALEGPARMAEQVPVARGGYDRLNRALPLLRLGAGRADLLPRAMDLLREGADLLHDAWKVFLELEEAESQPACPRCGAANAATARACGACGAVLPRAAGEAAPTPAPEGAPAHLQRLLLACEEAETGQMGTAEFASVLRWARQLVAAAEGSLVRLPSEDQLSGEVQEALQDLRQGMMDFRGALDELERFLDDGRPLHLSAGSRLLVLACQRLADVQNRATAPVR